MVSSPHTMPAPFIASEYLNPSTVPELRPNSPFRLGPTLFLPAARSWQALHLLNTFLPASASPAHVGPPDSASTSPSPAPNPISLRIVFLQRPRVKKPPAARDLSAPDPVRRHSTGSKKPLPPP